MRYDNRLKMIVVVGCIIGFLIVMGWAGTIDYTDQVILNMSQEEYDSIKQKLWDEGHGYEPSDRDIAKWWEKNHKD